MYWSCGVKESIHLPQHPAPNEHVANLSGSTGHIWHHRVVPLLLRPAQGLFGLPPMEGKGGGEQELCGARPALRAQRCRLRGCFC